MTQNVLCDRHHAGLLRSMQLLSDRLGWTLYVPVGLEWATEGYWQFGRNQGITDDLANQYLVPHEGVWTYKSLGYRIVPDEPRFHMETTDPEFPGAVIKGVTLAEARRLPWDFIVATLDDNQQGFRRFADEVGARYVLQVGNTGQYVDWSLDPLALVSSEVPILGQGVRYRQEMDPVATVYRDPREAQGHAASFVNCMPNMGGDCWAGITEAQELGFRVDVHGIDGPQGIIKPLSVLADRMAQASWGWHCKRHGDGYGHVIFGWAAAGRPLVGHAHHYRGKLAEPLWEDGVTCIDLDYHSIPEAVEMMRATTPQQHAQMCRAIRARFDALTDNEADAAAIADLLGIRTLVAA